MAFRGKLGGLISQNFSRSTVQQDGPAPMLHMLNSARYMASKGSVEAGNRRHEPKLPMNFSQLYLRSNSSFLLCNGNALQSSVLRLREDRFLVDAGAGTPNICTQDDLTGIQSNQTTRFENKVGFQNAVAGEPQIRKHILERVFVDLVAGETQNKDRAAGRFQSFQGSMDVAGEQLLLPRRFRQTRAWMELKKFLRTKKPVKGFVINKVNGGYSVAIAGFVTFLPFSPLVSRRMANDQFTVESIHPKKKNIVVI